jgi:hypothetical protein
MPDNKKPPVLEVLNGAKSPKASGKKPTGKAGGNGGGGDSPKEVSFYQFRVINGGYYFNKVLRDGEQVNVQLTNFTCRIHEEVIIDNDLTLNRFYRIDGIVNGTKRLPMIDVPIGEFESLNWLKKSWGFKPKIFSGTQKKDNIRFCIEAHSELMGEVKETIAYGCLGWRQINNQWLYLNVGGAISSNGLVSDISVELGGSMNNYKHQAPLSGDELKQTAKDALQLLKVAPDKPYIGAALLAAVFRAPLGVCSPIDFVMILYGVTGSRKSSVTEVAMSFFGDFIGQGFPSNFSDSKGSMELKAYMANCALYVIDDLAFTGTKKEKDALIGVVTNYIRNSGNGAGRSRLEANTTLKNVFFNRSMTIITGEDLPPGESIIGRSMVMELGKNDIDNAVLRNLQNVARSGRFGGLMSAYNQWLAPRIDQLKAELPIEINNLRDGANGKDFVSSHPRAPKVYANLIVGIETFLDFLESVDVIDRDEASDLMRDYEANIQTLSSQQGGYIKNEDDVNRFLGLLRSALTSGDCHIATRLDQRQPKVRPHSWGWVKSVVDFEGQQTYKPMGDCIGWYSEGVSGKPDEVFLERNSAFKVIQRFATAQGGNFGTNQNTLWQKLLERGLLLGHETDKSRKNPRPDVQRVIGGCKRRVLVVSSALIESDSDDTEQTEDDSVSR